MVLCSLQRCLYPSAGTLLRKCHLQDSIINRFTSYLIREEIKFTGRDLERWRRVFVLINRLNHLIMNVNEDLHDHTLSELLMVAMLMAADVND